MGLRQSKRSVDISGSPKKEAPAAVVEKIPQNNEVDTVTIEKTDEEIKSPVNGETKTTEREPVELEKSTQEDIKDKSITEVANDSKIVEESPSAQKDEKKEKVKKKRSFRSFSFLRREKKNKEENNKNGDVAKEPKTENVEQAVETAPVAVAEPAPEVAESAAAATTTTTTEEAPAAPKEDEAVVENQEAAPLATEEVATPAAEPTPEETPAAPAQEEATTECPPVETKEEERLPTPPPTPTPDCASPTNVVNSPSDEIQMLTLASNTQSMLAQTTGTTFDVASVIEEATGGETIANNPCAAADELVVAQGQKIDLTPAVEHGSGRAQSDDLADPTGERGAQVLHELSLDDCSRETTAEAGPGQSRVPDAQEQLCDSVQHARDEIVNGNNLTLVPQTIPKEEPAAVTESAPAPEEPVASEEPAAEPAAVEQEAAQPEAEPVQESEKKAEVASDESPAVQTSEE